jgi:hypothetical protein
MAAAGRVCGKMVGMEVACVRPEQGAADESWTVRLACACSDRNRKVVAGRAAPSLRGALAGTLDGFRGVMSNRCLGAAPKPATQRGAVDPALTEVRARGWRFPLAMWRRTLDVIARRR